MRRKLNKHGILFFMLGITIYSATTLAMDGIKSIVNDRQRSSIENKSNSLTDSTCSAEEIISSQLHKDGFSKQSQADVQLSVDLDIPSHLKNSLFIKTCEDTNSAEIGSVQGLIESGKRPPDIDEEERHIVLCKASRCGEQELVQVLITAGVDVNKKSKNGISPIVFAIMGGQGAVVKILIGAGANTEDVYDNEYSALHCVILELWRASRESKVNIGAVDIAKLLIESGADMEAYDGNGKHVLCFAVEKGLEEIVRLLLSMGVNVNRLTKSGSTALKWAFWSKNNTIVRLLIDAGADYVDKLSNTLLHMCAKSGLYEPDLLRLAISKNIHVNTINESGLTPLHCSAETGHIETVKWLLEAGAQVNCRQYHRKMRQTPLHYAARRGDLGIAKLLIGSGAKVNKLAKALTPKEKGSRALEYKTALSEAIENGKAEVVELLLGVGIKTENSFLQQAKFEIFPNSFADTRGMKESDVSLWDLLISKNHDRTCCNCQRVLKVLLQKGIKLATIKQSFYQHVKTKEPGPSQLDSMVMFQLLGAGLYKR